MDIAIGVAILALVLVGALIGAVLDARAEKKTEQPVEPVAPPDMLLVGSGVVHPHCLVNLRDGLFYQICDACWGPLWGVDTSGSDKMFWPPLELRPVVKPNEVVDGPWPVDDVLRNLPPEIAQSIRDVTTPSDSDLRRIADGLRRDQQNLIADQERLTADADRLRQTWCPACGWRTAPCRHPGGSVL